MKQSQLYGGSQDEATDGDRTYRFFRRAMENGYEEREENGRVVITLKEKKPETEPETRIAENAFMDSDIDREIAARKRGTPEGVERHWQSLPAWKVDQLTGRRGHA